MGDGRNHGFAPQVAACVACHADAEDLNINGHETKCEEEYTALKDALTAKGLLNTDGVAITKNADGSPILMDPKTAAAMFVYGALEEDASKGAHNPTYADALIAAALEALK